MSSVKSAKSVANTESIAVLTTLVFELLAQQTKGCSGENG